MVHVVVIMDTVAVDHLRGWEGDVGRAFYVLAQTTRASQIALAPKKTGVLAASIGVGAKNHWAGGIEVNVGANVGSIGGAGTGRSQETGYAMYTDQGTHRHSIRPRDPNGWMVFFWKRVGHTVYRKHVSHPGNRAYNWASRGMIAAMGAWR